MVEGVDASLGRILATLERIGVARRTVVIFTSDNGGLAAHSRGGTPHVHNAPLQSGKGSSYEGGTRVPLVIRWPDVVKPGTVSETPVISHDLFPTILALAGAPAVSGLDGKDLSPLLRGDGRAGAERALFWHYPHQWGAPGPGIHPFSSIRRGKWKLIHYCADERSELYDLSRDLGETRDLAKDRPDRAKVLRRELEAYLKTVTAQLPQER
jgi:arylsulfatase A-like enzyme